MQRNHRSPLVAAAWSGDACVVKEALTASAGDGRKPSGTDEATALVTAVQRGHFAVVRTMLEHGVDANRPGIVNGTPALMAAASYFSRDGCAMLELLHEFGGDTESKDGEEVTALHHAVLDGDTEAAQWLLEHGADVEAVAVMDSSKWKPLRLALLKATADTCTIRLLVKHGADTCP